MKNRLMFGAPVLVSCLGLMIGLLALWSGSLNESKDENLIQSVQQEIKLLRVATDEFSEKYATQLMQILEAEMVTTESTDAFKKSNFEALALGLIAEGKISSVDWYRSNFSSMDKSFFDSTASQLELDNSNTDQIYWKRVVGADRKDHMLLAVRLRVKTKESESVRLAIGVLPIDSMMELMSPYQNVAAEVFIVDSSGFSLASADTRYLGTQMDVHPIVSALSRHDKIEDFFPSRSLSNRPTMGGFQQAKNSNLFLVINRLPTNSYSMGWGLLIRSILIFFAFLALGVGLNLFLTKPNHKPSEEPLEEKIPAANDAINALEKNRMEREVLNRTLRAVSGGLRSSIYSLIGKCHLMMPKLHEPSLRDDVEFMEQELRKVRETIESIEPNIGSGSDLKMPVIDFSEIIRDSMIATSKNSNRNEIHLYDHLFPNALVRANRNDLEFVTVALLNFIIQKSVANLVKEIQLRSLVLGGVIRFEVIVPGLKIGADEAEGAFNYVQSLNVDLALSRLMVRGLGGDLTIITTASQCTIRMDLPKARSEEEVLAQSASNQQKEDYDTSEVEDDDAAEDIFETSEISMEIKDPALSNTNEIEPDDNEGEITRPIADKKIDDDTMEVKIRNPKVRLDL